jgi:V/A-type H+-transporting ATPase subunit A
MERTIMIANTSNMPVAAREASIYLGVTLAEYYRDQGHDVAIMADSTSRWAEALREISGVLEEMPAEAGYPAYLPDRIAEFYERAGRVNVLGNPSRTGSVSIIGAVSPPGGDFNEPVTIYTLRSTGVFWALDRDLAYGRHFPAIHWLRSYSLYVDRLLGSWSHAFDQYEERAKAEGDLTVRIRPSAERLARFQDLRNKALGLLSEFSEIESIARIMGERALPDDQRLVLLTAELVKEAFLRQFAFDDIDAYCDMEKQIAMLQMLIDFNEKARSLVRNGVPVEKIKGLPHIKRMERAKYEKSSSGVNKISAEVRDELTKIAQEYNVST